MSFKAIVAAVMVIVVAACGTDPALSAPRRSPAPDAAQTPAPSRTPPSSPSGREPPETDSTLTVHFGDGRRQRFTGVRGEAVTADLNGDDQDDLVIGGGWPSGGDPLRPRVFWGGPQGLRRGAALRTRATPAASGDYDHDARDEVVLIVDGRIQVWNERRMNGGFKIAGLPG